ncbi:hypothetical protein N7492_001544 [Penicillium capsulatum]|uniref:DNA repair metallo-beta-lactamase domain-containing protein n=1 Tax=Penicillium capsulatum TaxID=69766 RepID=A0A9W9IRT2_9EURO|nr:hypothetical protein N7492_001544 [Penicillium capsulatum]KAJ6129403.1 hypothetical protein N7512_002183 [Penicillium capsulatum]
MVGSYAKKASTPAKARTPATKRNTSILSFFQKTDTPPGASSTQSRMTQFVTSSRSPNSGRGTPTLHLGNRSKTDAAGGLFLEDKKGLPKTDNIAATEKTGRPRSRTPEDIWGEGDDFLDPETPRYNEADSAVKRRKVDSPSGLVENGQSDDAAKPAKRPAPAKTNNGPFIDESDSEDDMEAYRDLKDTAEIEQKTPLSDNDTTTDPPAEREQSPSVRDATSCAENDEFANFDDFEEDELVGEEFREEPWGNGDQRQRNDFEWDGADDLNEQNLYDERPDEGVSACPLCQKLLKGLGETEISIHVNDCLDGKPTTPSLLEPTPKLEPDFAPAEPSQTPTELETTDNGLTRIERAAIARPAQRDPYAQNMIGSRSAFSKMMAGNAEDTAWATAASNEVSSRGKQAYQRTCPFYKIMPGFSICVDAFRFGSVEGCNAYFLSHFHSDHYIGLSKSWCHGPIYCSRATANLVRQQLRVHPKWLVSLEFETTTEVPDTGGVQVTMIPANHCPGSSLFLFEKSFGQGPNARKERILHCGDFRVSPAQIQHPLLRPDTVNPLTGRAQQQRIDRCYLDTTYLSPKYAFPSQEEVITACSELCVCLNEEAGVGLDQGNPGSNGLMNKFLSTVMGKKDDTEARPKTDGRLLVVIGTYSIGKERICMGIARALGSKIFATPQKQRICSCLEDPELTSLLTSDPREAQVHMQTLFEIRADTLADYLGSLKPHFSRVVGFRPTGWSYRPPAGRMLQNPPVATVLRGEHWKTPFTAQNLTPQRGSTRESACFGVPYSEHSSFRELTMFCCALRIGRVIPTVNVGSQESRDKMKAWIERWEGEKKRYGLFDVADW